MIFLSSHQFEEVRRTCDRISIIKNGRLVVTDQTMHLAQASGRSYKVTVKTPEDIAFLENSGLEVIPQSPLMVTIHVGENFQMFFTALAACNVTDLDVEHTGLEEAFLHLSEKKENSL